MFKSFIHWSVIFFVAIGLAFSGCTSFVAEDEPQNSTQVLSPEEIIQIQKNNHWVLMSNTFENLYVSPNSLNAEDEIERAVNEALSNFERNCSERESFVARKLWVLPQSRSNVASNLEVPESIKEDLYSSFANSDYLKFHHTVDSVKNTVWFQNLEEKDKENFLIDLKIADECRDNLIQFVSNHLPATSRMSPGDRAVWREIAKNSSEEVRRDIIKASIESVINSLGGLVGGAIAAGVSIVNRLY